MHVAADNLAAAGTLSSFPDGGVLVADGAVVATGDFAALRAEHPEARVNDQCGSFLLPGFVDAHVHLPQLRVLGVMGATLLEWLERHTFPAELRFSDPAYARAGAREFLERLLRNGTTSSLVFGAHQPAAMDEFFAAARESRLRVAAGLVLGDRGLPEGLTTTPERAAEDSAALISRWHGVGRLRYAVTPRFALTASDELLAVCQELLGQAPELLFTTHLNETLDEITAVAKAFPAARDYLDTYERHGLLGPRSVFAHNVHPGADELARLGRAGSSVCHCASSNLMLGSGLFPLRRHVEAGVRVALGSDVGAGASFFLLDEALHAHMHQMARSDGYHLVPAQLLYLATRAGALALGQADCGNFEPGRRFDAVFLRPSPGGTLEARLAHAGDDGDALSALITLAREDSVQHVYVDGEPLLLAGTPCRMNPC